MPTPEKFLRGLTEKQLRQLISKEAKAANVNLQDIRESGAADLSGAYITKIEPYLREKGTKAKQAFRQRYLKSTSKAELINALQNLQYFNRYIGTPEQIREKAREQSERLGVDPEELPEFWNLVKWGYQHLAFKVPSDQIQKIITNRMRGGQSVSSIKSAFRTAAEAENGNDFIDRFQRGRGRQRWL